MRNETRFKYNAAMAQLAQLNNVEKVSHKFNVAPTCLLYTSDAADE